MITVTYAGADYKHPDPFEISRPFGAGVYVLILFRTKTVIELNGEEIPVKPNSMIIYDRQCPQKYRSDDAFLLNDFVHFNVDSSSADALFKNHIFNKPFHIEQIDSIKKLMWIIAYEYQNNYPNRERNLVHLVNVLLKKVEEEIGFNLERNNYGNYTEIISARNKIMQNPQYDWNISKLAYECNMSESYFQIAYKRLFGSKCISDVISARLEMAHDLILGSTSPIHEIAVYCGYNNSEHFSRQFKKKYGITPLKFRNQNKKQSERQQPIC